MDNLDRIKRLSRVLGGLCTFLLLALPIGSAVYWANFNSIAPYAAPGIVDAHSIALPLAPRYLFAAFLASMVPVGLIMYAVARVRTLFGHYGRGDIFTRDAIRCLHGLAYALILWLPAQLVYSPLMSLALTLGNEPGQRQLAIGFDEVELTTLFLGIVIRLISWVMEEARKLEEDNAQIV